MVSRVKYMPSRDQEAVKTEASSLKWVRSQDAPYKLMEGSIRWMTVIYLDQLQTKDNHKKCKYNF